MISISKTSYPALIHIKDLCKNDPPHAGCLFGSSQTAQYSTNNCQWNIHYSFFFFFFEIIDCVIRCLNLSHYLFILSKFVVFGKFCSLNPFCLLKFLSYISYMVVIIFLILCCCQEIQEKNFFQVITHKVMEMALLEGIQIYFILYGSFLMKTVKKKLWWSIRKSSCFLILFHY